MTPTQTFSRSTQISVGLECLAAGGLITTLRIVLRERVPSSTMLSLEIATWATIKFCLNYVNISSILEPPTQFFFSVFSQSHPLPSCIFIYWNTKTHLAHYAKVSSLS